MNVMDAFSKKPTEMRGYERYLVRFRGFITDPRHLQMMRCAYRLGKKLHRGQYRGDGVTYYFKHLRDVDEIITCELGIKDDWELNVAIWLHDSVEDGKISLDKIQKIFGSEVAELVYFVTKDEEYRRDKSSYVRRLVQSNKIRAIILKLADRLSNLRTLGFKSLGLQFDEELSPAQVEELLAKIEAFQIKQINETILEYLPLADHLVALMEESPYWSSPARRHVGVHLRDAIKLQIRSFRIEYGDRIIAES